MIPTRDRWQLLRRALRSVLSQENARVEAIVVDDASREPPDEETRSLLREATLLRQEPHAGVSAARNAGITRANAEWVAFLDHDDVWAPSKISTVIDAIKSAEAEFGYSSVIGVDDEMRPLWISEAPAPDDLFARLLRGNVVPGGGSGVVAKTQFVRGRGGFDERLSYTADWDLWLRLAQTARAAAVAAPLVAYSCHAAAWHVGGWGARPDLIHEELDRLARKHAALGVHIDRAAFDRYLARSLWWAGCRREAARAFISAGIRNRDLVALARGVGSFRSRRTAAWLRLFPRVAPPDPAWLAAYRRGSGPYRLGAPTRVKP